MRATFHAQSAWKLVPTQTYLLSLDRLDHIGLDLVLELVTVEVNVGTQHILVGLCIQVLLERPKALVPLVVPDGLQ